MTDKQFEYLSDQLNDIDTNTSYIDNSGIIDQLKDIKDRLENIEDLTSRQNDILEAIHESLINK